MLRVAFLGAMPYDEQVKVVAGAFAIDGANGVRNSVIRGHSTVLIVLTGITRLS